MYAAIALGTLKDPRSVEKLISSVKTDAYDKVKLAAIDALGAIGNPKAIDLLITLTLSNNVNKRLGWRSATALTKFTDLTIEKHLIGSLNTDNDEKWRAAFVLEHIGSADAEKAIDALLKGVELREVAINYKSYIKKGMSGTEGVLGFALWRFGNRTMAEHFADCGNEDLLLIASMWNNVIGDGSTFYIVSRKPRWGMGEVVR